jgi:hypothetical protein
MMNTAIGLRELTTGIPMHNPDFAGTPRHSEAAIPIYQVSAPISAVSSSAWVTTVLMASSSRSGG